MIGFDLWIWETVHKDQYIAVGIMLLAAVVYGGVLLAPSSRTRTKVDSILLQSITVIR
jgi:hypothetical protein